MRLFVFFITLVVLSMNLHAQSVDLSVNDDAVALTYDANRGDAGLQFALQGLSHKDDGWFVAASAYVTDINERLGKGVIFGLGGKLYGYSLDDSEDGAGVGLGGFIDVPISGFPGVEVSAQLYYAPDILTSSDTDNILDASVSIGYRIIPTAKVYVGVRTVEFELDDGGDVDLDSGAHIGLQIAF